MEEEKLEIVGPLEEPLMGNIVPEVINDLDSLSSSDTDSEKPDSPVYKILEYLEINHMPIILCGLASGLYSGNICGVDFIWLCNPSDSRKPLRTSWVEAVFSIIKHFRRLSFEETKELWVRADLDGNGVFDYEELKKFGT